MSLRSVVCGAALWAVASGCEAQESAGTAPFTGPVVVVANQRSGAATLVEVTSGRVVNVQLEAKPHEVAVSPNGRVAALASPSSTLRSDTRVVLLDVASAKVVRTIDLGRYRGPHGIEFVSDSVLLVGTLSGTSAVYADVRDGRVLRAVEGLPENPYVVKLTGRGRAYVSSPHSSKVTEIDVAAARALRTFQIPDDPAGIAVSADGAELWAAVWRQEVGGAIAILDLAKGAVVAKLPGFRQPRRLTITADGRRVVVSDRDHLRVVDRATRRLIHSVGLGENAGGSGVACAPDSIRCYVALSQAGEIVEVDVNAGRVLRRFAAERGVDGVGYVAR